MSDPIAFILCGGSHATNPGGVPWRSYVEWATETAPRLKRRNVKRVLLHNPGGHWKLLASGGDTREMRCDQWTLAERARAPFADRYSFRTAVGVLRAAGVKEVIVYVGSPTQLVDPVNELPAALEAFTACGPIVSFGFDAMFEDGIPCPWGNHFWSTLWAKGSPYRAAVGDLRRRHKVYAEARLHAGPLATGLGGLVDGTIADVRFDAHHNYDLVKQPGETIRVTATGNKTSEWPEILSWPAGVTPCLRHELNWGPLMDAAGGN